MQGNDLWKSFVDSRKSVPDANKLRISGLLKQSRYGPADVSGSLSDPSNMPIGSSPTVIASSSSKAVLSPGFIRSTSHHASQMVGTGVGGGRASSLRGSSAISSSSSMGASNNTNNDTLSNQQHLEAWKACGDMSMDQAKRLFLLDLYTLAPYWKYEQFL